MHTVNVEWLQCVLPCFIDVGRQPCFQCCCVLLLPHLHMGTWEIAFHQGRLHSLENTHCILRQCALHCLSSRVGREPGASGVTAAWLRVVNSEVVRILS